MLKLSRKRGESVVIVVPPSPVERRVRVYYDGQRCGAYASLGFEAHPDVDINREEIQAEIDARAKGGAL